MSTIPVTPAPQTFWDKLKAILPAIEMAGNIALIASGVGAPFEPLVAALEGATMPLIQSIGAPQTITSTLMTLYATMIGVLTALKSIQGLPVALLAEIDGYIVSAQNATAAYVQAESGFNPALYTPVSPIV